MAGGLPIPATPADVTAGWMQRALAAGGTSGSPSIRDLAVETIGENVGFLGSLLRCRPAYDAGAAAAPETVVVKLPSADPKSRRMSKRLSLPRREFTYYSQVAPHAPVKSPTLLYGDLDQRRQRFVFVFEDLGAMSSVDQIEGASAEQARTAVRAIARLHGRFWNQPRQPLLSGCYDATNPRLRLLAQAAYLFFLVSALKNFGHLFPERLRRLAEAFGPRVSDYLEEVAAGPITFIHGDFRADNLLFGRNGREDEFAVVDWQASALSSPLYDVAYFLGGSVSTETRRQVEREVLEEYHDIVCEMGARDFTFADCWRLYRRNMLGRLLITVFTCGGLTATGGRALQLLETGIGRTLAAIEDLDAEEFLPARRPTFSRANMVSALSHGAYRTYRGLRR